MCVESGAGVQWEVFEEREADHQTRQSAKHCDDDDAEHYKRLPLTSDQVVSESIACIHSTPTTASSPFARRQMRRLQHVRVATEWYIERQTMLT